MIRALTLTLATLATSAFAETQTHTCEVVEICLADTCAPFAPAFTLIETISADGNDRQGRLQRLDLDIELGLIDHAFAPFNHGDLRQTIYQDIGGTGELTVTLIQNPNIDTTLRASLYWPLATPPLSIFGECSTRTEPV